MRTRQTITISLPPAMAEQVEKTMRAENRTRSELVREALRTYIAIRQFPEETPTAAELRAIRRGRAAYKRGDYVTLDELRRREIAVAGRPRRTRAKIT
jgi:CopG family transcriptional regulator / antitoxin EndoAI